LYNNNNNNDNNNSMYKFLEITVLYLLRALEILQKCDQYLH